MTNDNPNPSPPRGSGRAVVAGGGAVAVLAAAAIFAQPLIERWEGERLVGYRDPIGIPTVCYGHTGPEVVVGQRYSHAQCVVILQHDMQTHGQAMLTCAPELLTAPPQVTGAMLSFVFNTGPGRFCHSPTMMGRMRARDWPGACSALHQFVYAGGVRFRGLVGRRADENHTCERGL